MTREQTTILKGVAILMMLFLHLFNNPDIGNFCDPLIFLGGVPLVNIISRACNPVGIFLMLSGYGLSYTYFHSNLSFKGQSRRLLKLYIHIGLFCWYSLVLDTSLMQANTRVALLTSSWTLRVSAVAITPRRGFYFHICCYPLLRYGYSKLLIK